MGIENDETMKVASNIPKRACHICGRPCAGWCPVCLNRYASRGRIPPAAMTPEQKSEEVKLLLSPPYEIPMLAIYRRICELLGRDIGIGAFFMLARKRESEQPRPLFGMKSPQAAPNAPTEEMPGVSIGPEAPDPASSDKEWPAVPTLKSFVRTESPTGLGIPTYIPPQPFPRAPSMEAPVVRLKKSDK